MQLLAICGECTAKVNSVMKGNGGKDWTCGTCYNKWITSLPVCEHTYIVTRLGYFCNKCGHLK